ncbi:MAG: hypothetical protein MUF32_04845 [Burkholderiaceae bacterium]|jgi:hypothetical protein|nr:hypothetical protein [Burkholderiaceae bacterium]
MGPGAALRALERGRDDAGAAAGARKRALLARLSVARLRTAAEVGRLHEVLCFLRAYPDDAALLIAVETMLARFGRRADLRAHREALAGSGIAGTTTWYPFFWPTARWLAGRWPQRLRFDRGDAEAESSLGRTLPLLVSPHEAAALREAKPGGYAAIDRLRARGETDATFLVRRVAALAGDDFTREAFYDAINPSCELRAGDDTPARTRELFGPAPVALRSGPLRRGRPDLRAEMRRAPLSVRRLPAAEGRRLVDLARGAMVTRSRDLDAFAYGNARDTWLIDDGDGLAFGLIGVTAERRAPLAAIYGGLTLASGVPIGYLQADIVGRSAAISFNTFATFRGGEAAFGFARLLAVLRHLFGVDAFSIEPYQLGQGNDEGIDSGAWWFYFKLGFRPRAAAARELAEAELARMKRRPSHRSSAATLRRLAAHHLFFDFDPRRRTPLPPLAQLGFRVGRLLAGHGEDRAAAAAQVEAQAAAALGLRLPRAAGGRWRQAFGSLAPLVLLAAAARWPQAERAGLAALIDAKAAASELDYARRLAAHRRLCRSLLGQ